MELGFFFVCMFLIPAGLCLLLFLFSILFFCMDVTWPSPENLSQQAVVFHSLFCLGLYMGCYLEHEVKVTVTFYNRLLYT